MQVAFDDGFTFGRGVFETIKVVNKRPLFLKAHLDRLDRGLAFFGLPRQSYQEQIEEFIARDEETHYGLKLIVTADNVCLVKRPDPYRDGEEGFTLGLSTVRRNATSPLTYHKTLCYYDNIYAHQEAQKAGFRSAFFLNEAGELTETAFGNLFLVCDGEIKTPTVSAGLLAGTMRSYLCAQYPITEAHLTLDDAKEAEEVFISNALMGVQPVTQLGDLAYNIGPRYQQIKKALAPLGF